MHQPRAFIEHICANFKLDLKGIHGTAHWSRVALNGRVLHKMMPEVDLLVTQLFAFIHDSQRLCDDGDELHGPRAADWAAIHCGKLFYASDAQLDLLMTACRGHTNELFSDNITVQACWDADRLDIGRCKAYIDRSYLGTSAAKLDTVMAHAMMRSRGQSSRL